MRFMLGLAATVGRPRETVGRIARLIAAHETAGFAATVPVGFETKSPQSTDRLRGFCTALSSSSPIDP
ncbi:hypothetical protein, partial [Alicyclobacillus sp.]|uniref:hypothetical protein n=1 Tax=Alicyclobacillus sp. TaxID=61169 RepID=UPI0025B7FD01